MKTMYWLAIFGLLSGCSVHTVSELPTPLPRSIQSVAPGLTNNDEAILQKALHNMEERYPEARGSIESGEQYVLRARDFTFDESTHLACQTITLAIAEKEAIRDAKFCGVNGLHWEHAVQTVYVNVEEPSGDEKGTKGAPIESPKERITTIIPPPLHPQESSFVQVMSGDGQSSYAPRPKPVQHKTKPAHFSPSLLVIKEGDE